MRPVEHKQDGHLAGTPIDAHPVPRWLKTWVTFGMVWLIIGMSVLPAGMSYSPGKIFQYGLGLTLFLPTLVLLIARPGRFLVFWRQPLVPWVLLLLVWGCVSLAWSHATRPFDEAGHNVSILLFLFAWQQCIGSDEERCKRLLVGCGLAMAVVALGAIIADQPSPDLDGRLVGFGAMSNANLAAGGMGAALMWLWPWRLQHTAWRVLKWLAIATLGAFIVLTLTRSALGALFMALVVVALSQGGRRAWLYAGLLIALGAACAVIGAHFLMARGWSARPEIFQAAMHLFEQHPLRGMGQGSPFELHADGLLLMHAHNMFSQLAIELGLPGLLLWTGIWLVLGWRAWRHRHDTRGLIVLGIWVFGTVMVQFDLPHLLDSPRPGWLLTWLPLALGMSFGRKTTKDATERL
ncbi:hypothetical protein DyAD56_05190 [Dyella sp. AD56]|nr:hypothetical protein DyAD56_05190 [Dyella sp. AD56]